jgi:hypothetical protein
MPSSNFQTLLVFDALGIPLYSARGLKQTLTPIAAAGANVMRDINGTMVNLELDTPFLKYASHIECGDNDTLFPLAFDGIWPGQVLTVHCVSELITAGSPLRPVVSGSQWTDAGGLHHYRPQLQMMITGWSSQESEWEATVAWTIDLEEV